MPRQMGQTLVLGGAPKELAQPHHILDLVLSWTCVSSPMTASYSISRGDFNHGWARMNTDFWEDRRDHWHRLPPPNHWSSSARSGHRKAGKLLGGTERGAPGVFDADDLGVQVVAPGSPVFDHIETSVR